MRLVFRPEELGDDRRNDAAHQPVLHLDHADLVTQLPDDCSNLEADVSTADDNDIACGIEVRADPRYVIDAAQVMQAVLVAPGYLDLSGA